MAKFDTYDTVPVRDVDPNDESPELAVQFAEEHNIGPNNTIIDVFSDEEKLKLNKMIKNGEFNQLEAAVLHYLMSEAGTLEDIGAMIGSVSRRTKGAATSRPAALKELNRILAIVAKRSKAKFNREIDLSAIPKLKREQARKREERRKQAKANERRAKEAEKEFYKSLRELQQVQRAHGLPVSKYYIRHAAPSDANIDSMPQFGGQYKGD